MVYLGLIKPLFFILLTNKHRGEISEPWMYVKAKIGTLKVYNLLSLKIIFDKYLA